MTYNAKPLIAAALVLPLAGIPAHAASKPADTNAKIEALEKQLETLKAQLKDLKQDAMDQKAEAQQQYAEIKNHYSEVSKAHKDAAKASVKNGAPMLSSADGKFTAKISANLQADYAYYSQHQRSLNLPTANGPDLSSGAKIRRAQIGLSGKFDGDWSYNFLYDFAGSGSNTPSNILYAYGQYDGFGPFAVRFGALLPIYGIEDQTGSTQLMFLERNTPTNITRGLAGSEGRMGVQALYGGDRFFGGLAFTMGKVSSTGEYDQQQALVGRASYMVVKNDALDAHFLVSGGFQHVFKLPDTAAGTDTDPSVTLKDMPELRVDNSNSNLINTGALNASHVTEWTLGGAGNYKNFYLQGEYNRIMVDRTEGLHNNNFNAWYVQGSWILTGESKTYKASSGSFLKPVPAHPFDLSKGDWGAWELAARYSNTNLNSRTGENGDQAVFGGLQKNITFGVNWYPNSTIRFDVDYMHIDIERTNASDANLGQNIDAVAMRAQVSF